MDEVPAEWVSATESRINDLSVNLNVALANTKARILPLSDMEMDEDVVNTAYKKSLIEMLKGVTEAIELLENMQGEMIDECMNNEVPNTRIKKATGKALTTLIRRRRALES